MNRNLLVTDLEVGKSWDQGASNLWAFSLPHVVMEGKREKQENKRKPNHSFYKELLSCLKELTLTITVLLHSWGWGFMTSTPLKVPASQDCRFGNQVSMKFHELQGTHLKQQQPGLLPNLEPVILAWYFKGWPRPTKTQTMKLNILLWLLWKTTTTTNTFTSVHS